MARFLNEAEIVVGAIVYEADGYLGPMEVIDVSRDERSALVRVSKDGIESALSVRSIGTAYLWTKEDKGKSHGETFATDD